MHNSELEEVKVKRRRRNGGMSHGRGVHTLAWTVDFGDIGLSGADGT